MATHDGRCCLNGGIFKKRRFKDHGSAGILRPLTQQYPNINHRVPYIRMNSALSLLTLTAAATATVLHSRDAAGPTINFGNNTGSPKHLASGILYGLPDNQAQIPSDLLSGFGFNYGRAAGAQVGSGWCYGQAGYEQRFASALSNYQLTRAHGGSFVLMLHDLWGFDTTQNSSCAGPGDNGDWSSYDSFLKAVIADINKNKMQSNLIIDIWNEPEGSGFWGRSIDQWLAMWGRGFYKLRSVYKAGTVQISGPTTAGQPVSNNEWFTSWASFVKKNNSIPDQYAWHEESGDGSSMTTSYAGLINILKQNNLPLKTVNINEYAIFDEEVPAGSAFWISQLERYNAIGLRGNWLGGTQLHDLAASLLSKPNPNDYASTGYFPNGDYQVYKYYAQNMTGNRVGSSVSADGKFDAYATVGGGFAKVLMGVRPPTTGTYSVTMNSLSALGLPTSGSLNVRTWKFPVGDNVHYGRVDAPTDLGYISHSYSGNTISLPYYQTDKTTAYAWEFAVGN